ncbi:hypothetical protein [Larkinella punicea]|uniref:T9SS C-terminal target domain-containing protein n=1 Tax=Larkinella punicea TaxID=2315727 RepID=A0A368JKH3_9BACT|nr:hypothetical protein [Larkinella punicea]RCR67795.1 hypothetical protein DUE52_20570 [Larkinella punicea]
MKTVQEKTAYRFKTLLVLLLLFSTLVGYAQPDYHSGPDVDKGYWKIQTDYGTRNTVIRFFNARNEPVYQETLRGQYVKLTKRNIRLFDEMLDRVVNNHLLASQVRSSELLASNDVGYSKVSAVYAYEETPPSVVPEFNSKFLVNPLVNSYGKLRINYANPDRKQVIIELTDESTNVIHYRELNRQAGYNRYFDVTHLLSGKYRLQVKGAGETMNYWLTIDKPDQRYELKAEK